jgi:hypothetical protein
MSKAVYQAPAVLRVVSFEPETNLLKGSVVNQDTGVKSVGQDVENYDFSGSSFNQDWDAN